MGEVNIAEVFVAHLSSSTCHVRTNLKHAFMFKIYFWILDENLLLQT